MRRLLVVAPTRRDLLNLADGRILARFDVVFEEQTGLHGVFGSSDSTAALAVVVADRLGLPGPGYEAFMRCHDKLACRRVAKETVPEATPAFAMLDALKPPATPVLPYPFFVKPVQGHLSQQSYVVDSDERLAEVLAAARQASFRHLIAEELLSGRLVTFEGFMQNDEMTPIGVTDAVMHENGISFLRFEYPSSLPDRPQQRMAEIAERLMPALGFDQSMFNIEFFVAPDGNVSIVEVNGRMASQYSPLVRAVHGVSSYEIQLELAAGGRPEVPAPRAGVVAASFVMRTYHDAVVRSVPHTWPVAERFPGSQIELLVHEGQRLSENDGDPLSHRLAVIALSGPDQETLARLNDEVVELLPFDLEPVAVTAAQNS